MKPTTNAWSIADKITTIIPLYILYTILVYVIIKGLNYLLTFINL